MKHFILKSILTSNIDQDENLTRELLSKCEPKNYQKGEYLLRPGKKLNHAFYVEKGLLRQYFIDVKGKEHILQFAPEGWFLADRESEYLNKPSSYFIDVIEDVEVLIINKELIQTLSESNPGFVQYQYHLLHRHIASLQKRITLLQSATATERYIDFIETYPDLLLRIPQTYIASYLGITPESLSRLRQDMAHKHKTNS
ncbi:MAG: Crp/Fnr family transcriptional regulator [Saprospiraceae bacterium]